MLYEGPGPLGGIEVSILAQSKDELRGELRVRGYPGR